MSDGVGVYADKRAANKSHIYNRRSLENYMCNFKKFDLQHLSTSVRIYSPFI